MGSPGVIKGRVALGKPEGSLRRRAVFVRVNVLVNVDVPDRNLITVCFSRLAIQFGTASFGDVHVHVYEHVHVKIRPPLRSGRHWLLTDPRIHRYAGP